MTGFRESLCAKSAHGWLLRNGCLRYIPLKNQMIEFYSAAGDIDMSVRVFRVIRYPWVDAYNYLISAYGLNGKSEDGLALFRLMNEIGIRHPNLSTFTAVMTCCSRGGLVREAKIIYDEYNLASYDVCRGSMINMLPHNGFMDEAMKALEPNPNSVMLNTILAWASPNLKLALMVFGRMLRLNYQEDGTMVTMANIHRDCGHHGQGLRFGEKFMREGKTRGLSSSSSY